MAPAVGLEPTTKRLTAAGFRACRAMIDTHRDTHGSEHLTPRQRELILRCSEPGATQEAVAEELGIAASTVKNTLYVAYRTLGVRTLAQAVRVLLAA